MKVKEILKSKGASVYTIGKDKTLADAVKVLSNNNIGVLLVLNDDGKTIGIISERDIVRAVFTNQSGFSNLKVSEQMTGKLIFVEPEDDLNYVEKIMTENRVRHLPVFQDGTLVGLISIGDIVKTQITDMQTENKYLMDYISGNVK